jgi:HEAT repeat protein
MALGRLAAFLIALGAFQEDPRTLIEQLRSDRAERRDEAARKLAELGKSAAPALEAAAKDSDAEVASRARQLLRRLSVRELLPPLLREFEDRLVTGGDGAWGELFVDVAAKAGGYYSPNLLERLAVPALKGAADETLAVKVVEAAAAWNVRAAIPELIRRLKDPSGLVRLAAARSLCDMKVKEALPALVPLLDDEEQDVRQYALHVLAMFEARASIPKMMERLKDPSPRVRQSALDALVVLRHAPALPLLLAHLKDENPSIRRGAIIDASELGGEEVVPALLPCSATPRPSTGPMRCGC